MICWDVMSPSRIRAGTGSGDRFLIGMESGRTTISRKRVEAEEMQKAAEKKSNCEDCAFRKKAEARPRSFLGILWRWHTHICPGWKSYQRTLRQKGDRAAG